MTEVRVQRAWSKLASSINTVRYVKRKKKKNKKKEKTVLLLFPPPQGFPKLFINNWFPSCISAKTAGNRRDGTKLLSWELYMDPNLDFLRWAQIILLRMFCVLLPYNCELKGISASYADNPTMEYLSMEFLRSYANF